MISIGITGSIGMGKTTIAKFMKYIGIPVYDSDKTVKNLLQQQDIIKKIKNLWPEVINSKTNSVNKRKIRDIIFSNKTEKIKIEKIIHPLIKKDKSLFIKKYKKNNKLLAFDVPLLYETKQEKNYDFIFLAVCNKKNQLKRVLQRNNIDIDSFNKIKMNQMSVEEKLKKKPIVINTDKNKIVTFLNVLYYLLLIRIRSK